MDDNHSSSLSFRLMPSSWGGSGSVSSGSDSGSRLAADSPLRLLRSTDLRTLEEMGFSYESSDRAARQAAHDLQEDSTLRLEGVLEVLLEWAVLSSEGLLLAANSISSLPGDAAAGPSNIVVEGEPSSQRVVDSEQCSTCAICLEDIEQQDLHLRQCGHIFHAACFTEFIQSRIDGGDVLQIPCPQCPHIVPQSEVRLLLSDSMFQRYEARCLDQEVALDCNRRWCPSPNCGEILHQPPDRVCIFCPRSWLCTLVWLLSLPCSCAVGGAFGYGCAWMYGYPPLLFGITCACSVLAALTRVCRSPKKGSEVRAVPVTCGRCGRTICFGCGEDWHPNQTCVEAADEYAETRAWAANCDTCQCPRCHMMIERTQGCNHMTCQSASGGCGHEFCWLCKETYQSGHFGPGRCSMFGSRTIGPGFLTMILGNKHPSFLWTCWALGFAVLMAELASLPLTSMYSTLWIVSVALASGSLARKLCPVTCECTKPIVFVTAVCCAVAWYTLWNSFGNLKTAAISFTFVELVWLIVIQKNSAISVRKEIKSQFIRLIVTALVLQAYYGFVDLAVYHWNYIPWYLVFFLWVLWNAAFFAIFVLVFFMFNRNLPSSVVLRPQKENWPLYCSMLARTVAVCALVASIPNGLRICGLVGAISVDVFLFCVAFMICVIGMDDNHRSSPEAVIAVPVAFALWVRLLGARQFDIGYAPDWLRLWVIQIAYMVPAMVECWRTGRALDAAGWRKWKIMFFVMLYPVCATVLGTLYYLGTLGNYLEILMFQRLLGSACVAHVAGRCGKLVSWPSTF